MSLKKLVWHMRIIPVLWLEITLGLGVTYARPLKTLSAASSELLRSVSNPVTLTVPVTTTTWFVENPAELVGYALKDISCPSATNCKAISDKAIFGWDGLVWAKEYEIQGLEFYVFYEVDCPTIAFCKVVGEMTSTISWDGTTWTADPGTENHLNTSVSCVSPDFCMVSSNNVFRSWDGQSWTIWPLEANNSTHKVSCVSPTFCMSTMSFFYGSHIWGGYIGVWDGENWAAGQVAPARSYFGTISCVSKTLCKATSDGLIYTWDGSEWEWSSGELNPENLICFSATFCKGIRMYALEEPYHYDITAWDGITWTLEYEATPPQTVKAIDCYSSIYCKAVGSGGAVMTMFTQVIGSVSEEFALNVEQIPGCLASLSVTELEELPPYATAEMLPGRFWQVVKEGCNQPITGSLALPMPLTLEPTDMVCTYTGRLWQCVQPTYNELMTQAIVTGSIFVGDWAIRRPGPNASAYQQFLPLIQR